MRFTLPQLQQLAASAGFVGEDAKIAAAVAMAESGGDPNAYGDPQYGGSLGLWQINLDSHPQYQADPNVLYAPATNAQAAYATWLAAGRSFSPWTTYRTGAYKRWYTPPAPAPSASKWGERLLVAAGIAAGLGLVALAVHEVRHPGALLPARA